MADSIESLRLKLKDKKLTASEKQAVRKKLVGLIKKKSLVKLSNGDPIEYHIIYDTFQQGLEPVYFWVLDFMRNKKPSGMGLEVNKVEEEFEASVGGGYFGEMSQKASIMQDRAIQILGHVNTIVRSILNLIYNLREMEMRLEIYDDADPKKQKDSSRIQAAEYSLKSVWMDQVDIKTGIGSINNLARGDLQFVTLRDAFFQVTKLKDINKLDLNKRVKIILKKKFAEYLRWREIGEVELRKRYSIEVNYLQSQVDSLRLYTKWAKPYLRAANKLGMTEFKTKSGLPSPDMVSAFSSMKMELTLMAKKKIDPKGVHPTYQKFKFDNENYACLEVNFLFRTMPQPVRMESGQQYVNFGVIDIFFRAYAMTKEDITDIEKHEVFQDMDLVENLTEVSLKNLQDDIDHFLDGGNNSEKEIKVKQPGIFESLGSGFGDIGKALGSGTKALFGFEVKSAGKYREKEVMKATQSAAAGNCILLYDIFKKAHRMITW